MLGSTCQVLFDTEHQPSSRTIIENRPLQQKIPYIIGTIGPVVVMLRGSCLC